MATGKNLLLSILAMDSYNRGYNQGIVGLDNANALIGSTKFVLQSNIVSISAEFQSGFYAIAYDTPYGTVIAYRGTSTDTSAATVTDALTGWPVGF